MRDRGCRLLHRVLFHRRQNSCLPQSAGRLRLQMYLLHHTDGKRHITLRHDRKHREKCQRDCRTEHQGDCPHWSEHRRLWEGRIWQQKTRTYFLRLSKRAQQSRRNRADKDFFHRTKSSERRNNRISSRKPEFRAAFPYSIAVRLR